jgi:hypothetical protein
LPNNIDLATDKQFLYPKMKAASFFILAAVYLSPALATASVTCVATHCSKGNNFVLGANNVGSQSIGSICGSIDSQMRNAVRNDKYSVDYNNDFCTTSGSNMAAIIQVNKQSPSHQANLVNAAVYAAFGSSGVNFGGCDVSGIPQ